MSATEPLVSVMNKDMLFQIVLLHVHFVTFLAFEGLGLILVLGFDVIRQVLLMFEYSFTLRAVESPFRLRAIIQLYVIQEGKIW